MDFITPFVIGALLGAAAIAGGLLGCFDVRTREKAAEEERNCEQWKALCFLAHAQNARLKVSLATGELAEADKEAVAAAAAAIEALFEGARTALREGLERQSAPTGNELGTAADDDQGSDSPEGTFREHQ